MKTNIVFMNECELSEAMDFNVVHTSCVPNKYPVVIVSTTIEHDIVHKPYSQMNNISTMKHIQMSVMWSEVRNDYKPEWFFLSKNIGKLARFKVYILDDDWIYDVFKNCSVQGKDDYTFNEKYALAEMIKVDELASDKLGECDEQSTNN